MNNKFYQYLIPTIILFYIIFATALKFNSVRKFTWIVNWDSLCIEDSSGLINNIKFPSIGELKIIGNFQMFFLIPAPWLLKSEVSMEILRSTGILTYLYRAIFGGFVYLSTSEKRYFLLVNDPHEFLNELKNAMKNSKLKLKTE